MDSQLQKRVFLTAENFPVGCMRAAHTAGIVEAVDTLNPLLKLQRNLPIDSDSDFQNFSKYEQFFSQLKIIKNCI